jgi:hypothetical protein
MSTFTPPQIGSKLGELKLSFLQRLEAHAADITLSILNISFRLGSVFILIKYGYDLIIDPFNPMWISIGLGIFLGIIGILLAVGQIYFFGKSDETRKTKEMDVRKSYSLFLVKNGVEVDSNHIPFKGTDKLDLLKVDGIEFFKVDGDYLLIKTIGEPYLKIEGRSNENGMKFLIEPKYLAHKEELLAFLNSLIDENLQ